MKFILGIFVIAMAMYSFAPKQKMSAVDLGKKLFFDPILSGDKTVSCASCHIPAFAFADTTAFSNGVLGRKAGRNTPSAMNMSSREVYFWDGRAASLEEQALGPIQNPNEMNCSLDTVIQRLNSSKEYMKAFQQVFNEQANIKNLQKAIAEYERTLETANTANDRWLNDKMPGLTSQQQRGRTVFFNKGKCIECHFTPDFTGDEFRSIGLFDGQKWNDSGRYLVTKKPEDIAKFRVPGLRNVAVTAPYMHDGSFKTLEEVIDFYDQPQKFVKSAVAPDSLLLQPLQLSVEEKSDLKAFLMALTDDQFLPKKSRK